MDSNSKAELNSIISELNSIISELESISNGIRNDFVGIGNDRCASCIDKVIDNYCTARRKLNNLDTNTLTQAFIDMIT